MHASVSLHGAGPVTHEGGTGKQALDASLVLLVHRVWLLNECVSPPGVNEDVSTYTLVLILEGEPFSAYNMSVHGCGHERVITIMASRKAVAGSLALHCYMFDDMSFACLGVDVGVKCNIASRPPSLGDFGETDSSSYAQGGTGSPCYDTRLLATFRQVPRALCACTLPILTHNPLSSLVLVNRIDISFT